MYVYVCYCGLIKNERFVEKERDRDLIVDRNRDLRFKLLSCNFYYIERERVVMR